LSWSISIISFQASGLHLQRFVPKGGHLPAPSDHMRFTYPEISVEDTVNPFSSSLQTDQMFGESTIEDHVKRILNQFIERCV
jgi:hypothetical protein